MVFLPASILVLLYAFPSANLVSAQSSSQGTISLPNDITNYLPTCAQTCFQSFIEINFPKAICSTSPTLDCLCAHNGTSGYTAGEGAVQCIIAEKNLGFCQGGNGTQSIVLTAYNMCVGRPNSVPNIHSTITATLVVQTSEPSFILVASTSKTDGGASTRATSISIGPTPEALSNTATGSGTGSASPGSTANATAQAASQTAQSSATPASLVLTTPQIIGVAVGSAAVGILAVGGLVAFACVRRRKMLSHDDRDSDFGTFHIDHGNSMEQMFRAPTDKKLRPIGPGGTANGLAARVPPVVPPRVFTDPNMFSRRSIRTEEIGIAISPDMDRTPERELERKHSSRLLPEKPSLKVVVPQQSTLPKQVPLAFPMPVLENTGMMGLGPTRDSALTTFEEDVVSAEADSGDPSSYNYAYPFVQNIPTADDRRNWQHRDPPRSVTAPLEGVPKPLDIRKTQSHQSFSQPLQPRTAASSLYSEPDLSGPALYGNGCQDLQQSKTYQQYRPYRANPHVSDGGSITSIDSSTDIEPRQSEARAADLSPVAESPVGRSPVSYPKIKRPLSNHMYRAMQPATQLDFEPWRRPEIEQERRRKNQMVRDKTPARASSKSKINGRSLIATNVVTEPSNNSISSPIAERRGNRLAPALDLTKQAPSRNQAKWRVLDEDSRDNVDAWQPKLTPQKIGDDLFLNVQRY